MPVDVGSIAPDFELASSTGETFSLKQFKNDKIVILSFHPRKYDSAIFTMKTKTVSRSDITNDNICNITSTFFTETVYILNISLHTKSWPAKISI